MPTLALVAWLACLLARESGLGTGCGTGCGTGTGFNTPLQVIQSFGGIKLIEDEWAHIFVMFCRVMFCVVICNVGAARGPEDSELFLIYSVTDPVEAHVDRFRSLLFDGAVHDAGHCRVVSGQLELAGAGGPFLGV